MGGQKKKSIFVESFDASEHILQGQFSDLRDVALDGGTLEVIFRDGVYFIFRNFRIPSFLLCLLFGHGFIEFIDIFGGGLGELVALLGHANSTYRLFHFNATLYIIIYN